MIWFPSSPALQHLVFILCNTLDDALQIHALSLLSNLAYYDEIALNALVQTANLAERLKV